MTSYGGKNADVTSAARWGGGGTSTVMPKGVFSIFKKDPQLIYDLLIFITDVYLIILLLLNNFEFVLSGKQSNFRPNFYAVTYLVV